MSLTAIINTVGTITLLDSIEKGISFHAFERVGKDHGLPLRELAEAIGLSERTLMRRKNEKRLSRFESDRLVSVTRFLAQTLELFEGNKLKAVSWLRSPVRALGGRSPLEMAGTETGLREAENLIGRLEHGVFS
jgi:putative toxin-antitoxin system antitoxin component (TIGR02293 family)